MWIFFFLGGGGGGESFKDGQMIGLKNSLYVDAILCFKCIELQIHH